MSEQVDDSAMPVLEEYHFHSQAPVLGPFIGWLRTAAYNVAARWGVQHVIVQQNQINTQQNQINAQQNQINAQLLERLQELEARLIDQDRDLTLLARTTAEVDIRQRFLAKTLTPSEHDDQT